MSNNENKTKYSRRDFLKVVGAAGGLAASGCAPEIPEKIIPYVVQPEEIIPGVATWYAASCRECLAGCGVLVRTREGRAVKLEGNPSHPINRGGLCARGHSALQAHYDPDRLREPQKREANKSFTPIEWEKAIVEIAEYLKSNTGTKDTVLITAPLTGSEKKLTQEFVNSHPRTRHIEYSLFSDEAYALAAEKYFGSGKSLSFDFSEAEVVVSFGADYLETWISPVEFSRQWAKNRGSHGRKSISYCVHFEPRLSLTAANVDNWVMNSPGSDLGLLASLLEEVLRLKSSVADSAAIEAAKTILAKIKFRNAKQQSQVSDQAISDLAKKLSASNNSLVVAGGASIAGDQLESCALITCAINDLLGNIGKGVRLHSRSSNHLLAQSEIRKLVDELNAKQTNIGAVIVAGVNPVYALPKALGFQKALTRAGIVVSLATAVDETSQLANYLLPLSTQLESWGDSEPRPGIYNLNQPSMQPLYKTQSLGDSLIAIASKLKFAFADVGSFHEYIRKNWKERIGAFDFEKRWLAFVERGGDWSNISNSEVLSTRNLTKDSEFVQPSANSQSIKLIAYPNIKSSDGSMANRSWMQELPDPLTTAVWGTWVDVHPDTAAKHGLADKSVVQIKTAHATVEVPLRITKNIHPNLIAVPIGQGHSSYGRYAAGVGANPLEILKPAEGKFLPSFLVDVVSLEKSIATEELVRTQEFYEQFGRGIYRSVALSKLSSKHSNHKPHDAHVGGNGSGHHDPLALGPQEDPKQMYHQFESPLYRWGMSIDLASCTGCSACVVACNAENNVPMVGKELVAQGREMSWIRIQHYENENGERPVDGFMPMMCQHCGNAPCEPVCPVYATYHNEEGLNQMVYNRCVGTRYCSNNCTYKVRRFNWYQHKIPEPLNWQLNPDVTMRVLGVMEKCTFCVQRIKEVQNLAKDEGRVVRDGEVQPACASSCPTQAIKFGNLKDHSSDVFKNSQNSRAYKVLDSQINTQPAISYLARIKNDSVKLG